MSCAVTSYCIKESGRQYVLAQLHWMLDQTVE
jgi:hypothetical protein